MWMPDELGLNLRPKYIKKKKKKMQDKETQQQMFKPYVPGQV